MAGIPLKDIERAIVYNAPTTSTALFKIKRASYMKGEFPEHLKKYAGQIKDCPVKCKGKKGSSYRECLTECAKKVKKA